MRAEVSEAEEVPGPAGFWRLPPAGVLPVASCACLQGEEGAEGAVVLAHTVSALRPPGHKIAQLLPSQLAEQ